MTLLNQIDPTQFFAHHIGGRAGSISFPDLVKFSKDIAYFIYDADNSCLEQIENIWIGRNVKVLPYCLSDKCGKAKFNINYDPYTSSLFPLNPSFGNYYNKEGNYDKVCEFVLKTEKIIDLETKTLDTLVEDGIISPPDFLSIDTQGAELLILKGASQCLANNTVAVQVEVNFASLYEGAPLFGELDEFLRSRDFILAELTPFNIGYKRIPESYRGKGIPLQGEALYLLRPDAVKGSDEIEISLKLDKLAFAATAFGFTELAFAALERSLYIAPGAPKSRSYQRFLQELYQKMRINDKMPLLWHEIFSFNDSNDRFSLSQKTTFVDRALKKFNKNPIAFLSDAFSLAFIKVFCFVQKVFSVFRIHISIIPRRSKFYYFLRKNGFHLAAQRILERKQKG